MTITTQNGSKYVLNTKKDGRTYFTYGMSEYRAIIINLEIGFPLELNLRKLDPYTCKPGNDVSFLRTSPVISIE